MGASQPSSKVSLRRTGETHGYQMGETVTVSSTAGSSGLTMDSGDRPAKLHTAGLCRARKDTEEPCGQLRSPLGNGFPRAFKPIDVVPPLPQLVAP